MIISLFSIIQENSICWLGYKTFENNVLESELQMYSSCFVGLSPSNNTTEKPILATSEVNPTGFYFKITFCFDFHSFLLLQFNTQYIVEGSQLN